MKRQFIVIAAVVCLLIGGVASYFGLRTSVPNEKTMSRILADIYTADALVQEGLGNYYKKEKLEESLYSSIFSHYGLSKAQYDEAVLYYTAKPEKWSEIYEKAISILSVREGELSAFAAKCDSADLSLSNLTDSITTKFGKWASTIRLPLAKEDTLNKYVSRLGGSMSQIAVNIHIDSIRGGHITIVLRVAMWSVATKHRAAPSNDICRIAAHSHRPTILCHAQKDGFEEHSMGLCLRHVWRFAVGQRHCLFAIFGSDTNHSSTGKQSDTNGCHAGHCWLLNSYSSSVHNLWRERGGCKRICRLFSVDNSLLANWLAIVDILVRVRSADRAINT